MSSLNAEPDSLITEHDVSLYVVFRTGGRTSVANNAIRILRAEADNYVLETSHALHFFVTYIFYNDAFFH
jgi:hypothetical protein